MNINKHTTDEEIIGYLIDLDESDADCTAWECDFLENVAYGRRKTLTDKQREVSIQILRKYEDYL